jgi:PAS domain S-box-containing protein
MNLRLKIWLILGMVLAVPASLSALLDYRQVERVARAEMRRQAVDLRAALMATRRVYHRQFLDSGLPLDDRTVGFLPAHAMTRIARDYPNWTTSGVRFNNVSDRPRNPDNRADADELAAMAWFRTNPGAGEYTGMIRDRRGGEFFHFAAPIWTEPYCLKCHASPEDAPGAIRERYNAGYGYRTGDLRGVLSIRIPAESGRQSALGDWQRGLLRLAVMLLALFVTLGLLLNHLVTRRVLALNSAVKRFGGGDYAARLDDERRDEIGELARGFNAMAGAIDQRERALKASESRYRTLVAVAPVGLFQTDGEGRCTYVSAQWRRIAGLTTEEALGDGWARALHPADRERVIGEWAAAAKEQRRFASEYRFQNADGQTTWVLGQAAAETGTDGKLAGYIGTVTDISARKRAEELERFGAFQAGIAEMSTSVLHNIGNAITAVSQEAEIIGRAGAELSRVAALLDANASRGLEDLAGGAGPGEELVRRQCEIQREASRAIRRLSEEDLRQRSRRLGESVRHIADIVRIQQTAALPGDQRGAFSLSQAIQSALEMQGDAFDKRAIRVTVAVDPAADPVSLPQNRLLQVLINVIRNSIESIDERARGETFQGRLDVRAEPADPERLRIIVEDNGAGFAPETRDKLFNFGFSTKQRGTGFGLHSVAVFAQECGGRATLDSGGANRGARFTLDLPRALGTPPPGAPLPPDPAPGQSP